MLWLLGKGAAGLALAQEPTPLFKAEVRLVEVYATVFDQKGKYLDGLTQERFEILDNGERQAVSVFESHTADLSCAILFDTTGSMTEALPVVKNAIVKLIDQLRADDWVAVYTFSTSLQMLQDFTRNKQAAKRAVLRTRAEGMTALFDAITQVAAAVSRRNGKKAIVVFTDGHDTASVLGASAAATRARKLGVPFYGVAQGEALKSATLVRQLKEIAQMTGGRAYTVRKAREVEAVFQDISTDLQHTYLLAYRAPHTKDPRWRSIQMAVKDLKDYRLRAREGYFPE